MSPAHLATVGVTTLTQTVWVTTLTKGVWVTTLTESDRVLGEQW
jgi:hypothetical protein